ncbi:hypothetical protein [Streptosporangium minutum]|uniref:Uncharacterized protein n=1 Tax=Streptosporangium minutum TaxID=569862 RepID=A0A243RPJ5_9ACTN|nr:hypothetical protein [Streptosporangium minutum]OUC96777.1 hypothetical protein CA984_13765 [Streptosporangium minutum]
MEFLLGIAIVIVIVYLIASSEDSEEHPGWRGIPKPTSRSNPPFGVDRKSWKRTQRRNEQITREVRKQPPYDP